MKSENLFYFQFGNKVKAATMLLGECLNPFQYQFGRLRVLSRWGHFYDDGLHLPFANIALISVDNDAQLVVRPYRVITVYLPVNQYAVPQHTYPGAG